MKLLLLRLLTLLGRGWLRLHGVHPGPGGWVHGFPEVRLKAGSSVTIGSNVTLCSLARFNPLAPARRLSLVTNTARARIVIKDGVGISNATLSCHESITIGANTLIGAECLIVDSDFHGLPLGTGKAASSAPVEIGDEVFIGARAVILKGVKIGAKAIIGAGAVVARDVPPGHLAVGNPARCRPYPEPKQV